MSPKTAISVAIVGICAAACASAVDTPERAILLASKVCQDSRHNYYGWDHRSGTDPKLWHAQLFGDHWRAWTGDEADPILSVNIPRSGSPIDPDAACYRRPQD